MHFSSVINLILRPRKFIAEPLGKVFRFHTYITYVKRNPNSTSSIIANAYQACINDFRLSKFSLSAISVVQTEWKGEVGSDRLGNYAQCHIHGQSQTEKWTGSQRPLQCQFLLCFSLLNNKEQKEQRMFLIELRLLLTN